MRCTFAIGKYSKRSVEASTCKSITPKIIEDESKSQNKEFEKLCRLYKSRMVLRSSQLEEMSEDEDCNRVGDDTHSECQDLLKSATGNDQKWPHEKDAKNVVTINPLKNSDILDDAICKENVLYTDEPSDNLDIAAKDINKIEHNDESLDLISTVGNSPNVELGAADMVLTQEIAHDEHETEIDNATRNSDFSEQPSPSQKPDDIDVFANTTEEIVQSDCNVDTTDLDVTRSLTTTVQNAEIDVSTQELAGFGSTSNVIENFSSPDELVQTFRSEHNTVSQTETIDLDETMSILFGQNADLEHKRSISDAVEVNDEFSACLHRAPKRKPIIASTQQDESHISLHNQTLEDLPGFVVAPLDIESVDVGSEVVESSDECERQSNWAANREFRPIEIAVTNLMPDEITQVDELAQILQIRRSNQVTESTTHLITRSGITRGYCRTLKIIQAIARHIYILDFDWVTDSLSTFTLMNETDYEMKDEIRSTFEPNAPMRSRLAKLNDSSHTLFPPLRILFTLAQVTNYTSDDLASLADVTGALIVRNIADFLDGKGGIILISPKVGDEHKLSRSYPIFKALFDDLNVRSIQSHWFLDCIAGYDMRPFGSYSLYDENLSTLHNRKRVILNASVLESLVQIWQH
ncbi:hypothetical protein ACOME3_005312 [Neoechinorhynchus agilis]